MRKFAASAAIILALATGCPSQAGESAYTDFQAYFGNGETK
jgi:hypothetical protein